MKKIKLRASDKAILREMGDEFLQLQGDWQRRLRNALLNLALNDPRWMAWVEREIDPESMSLIEITRMVEARARNQTLKAHSYFGRNCIGSFIFRDDWVFTDRGNLGPG
jgi:hypothetical protein